MVVEGGWKGKGEGRLEREGVGGGLGREKGQGECEGGVYTGRDAM